MRFNRISPEKKIDMAHELRTWFAWWPCVVKDGTKTVWMERVFYRIAGGYELEWAYNWKAWKLINRMRQRHFFEYHLVDITKDDLYAR